jgi:hypothetical protein
VMQVVSLTYLMHILQLQKNSHLNTYMNIVETP